jgi:hypothetical protein
MKAIYRGNHEWYLTKNKMYEVVAFEDDNGSINFFKIKDDWGNLLTVTNKGIHEFEFVSVMEELKYKIDEKLGMNEKINPEHYTQGGIEVIDFIESKMTKENYEGFLLGNVLKYVSRYKYKNGVEDLAKADWYLDRLISLLEE